MNRLRRKKRDREELRRDQLRKARLDAPTLRTLLPAAEQVSVELTFDMDARLAQAPVTSTVFPPAQAHFVYGCPFGDCDGTYDLDAEIFGMLREGVSEAIGAQHCCGHRASRSGHGPRCGLGVTYAVTVQYQAQRIIETARPAAAL
jgi:hypothetical protein